MRGKMECNAAGSRIPRRTRWWLSRVCRRPMPVRRLSSAKPPVASSCARTASAICMVFGRERSLRWHELRLLTDSIGRIMLLGRNVKLANYCDFSHANQKFLVKLSPWLHLFGHAATLAKPSMQFCAGGWIGISSVVLFFVAKRSFS